MAAKFRRIHCLIRLIATKRFIEIAENPLDPVVDSVSLSLAAFDRLAMTFLHVVNVSTKKATFGMGCFWGVESLYGATKGVIRTRVGFTGGKKENPVYKNLGDHTEAVELDYDPSVISYGELLDIFWSNHNPTARMSKQYTSVIYYHDDEQKSLAEKTLKEQQSKTQHVIVTTVEPAKTFYNAEDYHQKYRLQQHSYLMDAIQLKPKTESLINSHIAARLNGYVVGFGGVNQLEEEAEKLGLTGKVLDYVKNLVEGYLRFITPVDRISGMACKEMNGLSPHPHDENNFPPTIVEDNQGTAFDIPLRKNVVKFIKKEKRQKRRNLRERSMW